MTTVLLYEGVDDRTASANALVVDELQPIRRNHGEGVLLWPSLVGRMALVVANSIWASM